MHRALQRYPPGSSATRPCVLRRLDDSRPRYAGYPSEALHPVLHVQRTARGRNDEHGVFCIPSIYRKTIDSEKGIKYFLNAWHKEEDRSRMSRMQTFYLLLVHT